MLQKGANFCSSIILSLRFESTWTKFVHFASISELKWSACGCAHLNCLPRLRSNLYCRCSWRIRGHRYSQAFSVSNTNMCIISAGWRLQRKLRLVEVLETPQEIYGRERRQKRSINMNSVHFQEEEKSVSFSCILRKPLEQNFWVFSVKLFRKLCLLIYLLFFYSFAFYKIFQWMSFISVVRQIDLFLFYFLS